MKTQRTQSRGPHSLCSVLRIIRGWSLGRFDLSLTSCLRLRAHDRVTDEHTRLHGHGARLLGWLAEFAWEAGCEQLHLDSGVQRSGAHRFYLGQRMDTTSHHLAMMLVP